MQYKAGERLNLGSEAEPVFVTVEQASPQVIVVRWESPSPPGTTAIPVQLLETLAAPITENTP